MNGSFEIKGITGDQRQFESLDMPDRFSADGDKSLPFIYAVERLGVWAFVDSILNDTEISPSFYDGMKVQEVIESVLGTNLSAIDG